MFEALGEVFEVGLVRNVDGSDEIDRRAVLFVARDSGLEASCGVVLIDADEIAGAGRKSARNMKVTAVASRFPLAMTRSFAREIGGGARGIFGRKQPLPGTGFSAISTGEMTSSDLLRYCPDLLHYSRRPTREVMVGNVGVGGDNPIRVQSMITSDTRDTPACVAEVLGLAEAGCEIVRITAQTKVYAANLENIAREVRAAGCNVPLVADIHFKPDAALEAAKWVEKVRVNPGNYADKKKFEIREYSDAQYAEELERIREEFTPLVMLCKDLGRAMRIGTNHGSLSDRIMNRYGDTPLGMV